ncbi:MAG: DUF4112 domain-containing protein [Myxococcota bacterium]
MDPSPPPVAPVSVTERRPWLGRLARGMDDLGLGFGLDPILGFFFPGIGDAVTGSASLAILVAAVQERVPFVILLRMLLHLLVDTVVGVVPVAGDLFDAVYRANLKNLDLLEKHAGTDEPPSFGDWLVVVVAGLLVAAGIAIPFVFFGGIVAWLGGLVGA